MSFGGKTTCKVYPVTPPPFQGGDEISEIHFGFAETSRQNRELDVRDRDPRDRRDLAGEVEMKDGAERGVEHQSDTSLKEPEELTMPAHTQENKINMLERPS